MVHGKSDVRSELIFNIDFLFMPLKFNDIAQKLNVANKPKVIVLLLEYGAIKYKLDNPETQTWYFKKDIDGKKKKLKTLNAEFEKIRDDLNGATLDTLFASLNEKKRDEEKILGKGYLNTIDQIFYSNLLADINYINDLIRIKNTVGELNSIDYYIDRPEEILRIME